MVTQGCMTVWCMGAVLPLTQSAARAAQRIYSFDQQTALNTIREVSATANESAAQKDAELLQARPAGLDPSCCPYSGGVRTLCHVFLQPLLPSCCRLYVLCSAPLDPCLQPLLQHRAVWRVETQSCLHVRRRDRPACVTLQRSLSCRPCFGCV